MGSLIRIEDEFASTMQQLSAEAEKKSHPEADAAAKHASQLSEQMAEMIEESRTVGSRVLNLEVTLEKRLREISGSMPTSELFKFGEQLKRMDEQITAIRNTESVNQRLFDSLHHELISYRDNFLHESLQKPFIRDLVVLFDDLTGLLAQLETSGKSEPEGVPVSLWHNNLENAIHSIVEILHRLEVSEIEPKEKVDRTYHRVVTYEPTDFAEEEGRIVMRVRRGFLWRGKVLRPEEVIAKRFD
ncbi:MAG: nucleotide exchange factor GrpE [Verrucomicrobiota bacterium]